MRTVVIDTNVLLSQPESVNSFHGADVVIPKTVLAEIDKLKTARVDPDLRFKGRQISRILFELSEQGNLSEGVDLPGGGALRIVGLAENREPPKGLSVRNADDQILAIALQVREGQGDVTLVTNDLNMLLKAQSFGLEVERVESSEGFARRFIIRPAQRYRIPLTILAVSIAVFLAVVYLTILSPFAPGKQATGISALPPEFVEQLSVEQQQLLNYLYRLQANPKDLEAHRSAALIYDSLSNANEVYLQYALRHWEAVTTAAPNDAAAWVEFASDQFRSHKVGDAITSAKRALAINPDNVNANFNLGVFYMNTEPKDYQAAANQFSRVLKLTENVAGQQNAATRARTMLEQVKKDAAAAGRPIKNDGGTL